MKFPLKNLILAASFSVATVAHAQGFAVDAGSLDYYLKQAQTTAEPMQGAGAQALVAQTETPPVNLGAPPSTYAPSSKAPAAPSADTNQQILAELVRIDATLGRLLEVDLERANATAPAR